MPAQWVMPKNRYVVKNEARTNLAAIVEDVRRTKTDVWIGSSEDTALSCIISVDNYERDKQNLYPDGVFEKEIDDLRKNWSRYRTIVEFTGKCQKILKRGVAVAVLVPSAEAYSKYIDTVRETIREDIKKQIIEEVHEEEFFKIAKEELASLANLKNNIIDLFKSIRDELPTREELEIFTSLVKQFIAMSLPEWRERHGYPPVPVHD